MTAGARVRTWAFLRHGQCAGNVERHLAPSLDSPLTSEGAAQVVGVRAAVWALAPARVVASPALRVRQTVGLLAQEPPTPRRGEGLNQRQEAPRAWSPHVIWSRALREREFGPLDAWTIEAVRESDWAEVRATWGLRAPGGESLAEVGLRAVRVLGSIPGTDPALVVAHAGVIRTLVGLLDGTERSRIGCLRVPPAQLWVRQVPAGRWAALRTELEADVAAEGARAHGPKAAG